jgi:hypothetical protein
MPARNTDPPLPTEAAISVSTMAHRCGLSRARFYELIQSGIMPQPCYCLHTHRPLYPRELVEVCLLVRSSNIGVNGQFILFYSRSSPVAAETVAAPRSRRARSSLALDDHLAALREGLASLGMASVTDAQITAALASAFPAGTNNLDQGAVLAGVFRQLRSPQGVGR